MNNWTIQARIAAKTYWLITGLFGAFYGLYGYYAFAYLDLLSPESSRIFDALLFVLAATMLFELIAEPITGHYADAFGRRQAVVIAFAFCTIAFVLYAAISINVVKAHLWSVVLVAIVAELVIAVGLAFHSGSLDSWVVEQIYQAESTRDVETEPVFAIANIVFAVGLTLGGMTGAFALPKSGVPPALWPWFLSAFLSILTILVAAVIMHDPRPGGKRSASRALSLTQVVFESFRKVMLLRHASRQIWTGILITSTNYVIGIVFIYFAFLTAKNLLPKNIDLAWLSLAPFFLLLPRLLGPWLSMKVTAGATPHEEARYRALMTRGCFALGVSCLALGASVWAIGSPEGERVPETTIGLYVIAGVSAFLTSMLLQMIKPIATSYLNHYIVDNSDRAFLNSMATPFGGAVVALLSVLLLIWNHGNPIPKGQDLALIFVVPGAFVVTASILIYFRGSEKLHTENKNAL